MHWSVSMARAGCAAGLLALTLPAPGAQAWAQEAPRSISAPTNFEGVWQPDFVPPLVEAGEGTNGALATVERKPLPYNERGSAIFHHRVEMEQRGTPVANSVSLYLPALPVYQLDLFLGAMQIVQDQENVVILYEDGSRWHIRLNRDHPAGLAPSYAGDSVGHFEGDVLVVDSIGFNDRTWLDAVGSPHTDRLRLVTRISKIEDGRKIEFLTTYDDPGMYTRPFTVRRTASFRPDMRLLESEIENMRAENNANLIYEDFDAPRDAAPETAQ